MLWEIYLLNKLVFSSTTLLRTLQDFPQPSGYMVAFSGGVDSTCLLHAIAELRQQLLVPVPIRAVHIDHGLQQNSGNWASHCQQICNKLHIDLLILPLDLKPIPGESIEALARQARLAAFATTLGANEMLLTAHHQNDQAETLLLQLLRGSGLAGLAGMPYFTTFAAGWLARPLLKVTQMQLDAYARINQLDWVEDPSNAKINFDRNYLRHHLLPMVAKRWPAYSVTLSRSAEHCAEAMDLLDHLLTPYLLKTRGNRPGTLSIKALQVLSPSLCRAVLRRWIHDQGFLMPNKKHLERIRSELMLANADRSPLITWKNTEVRRYRDDIFLLSPLPSLPKMMPIRWHSGQPCQLPTGMGSLHQVQVSGSGIDPISWNQGHIEIHFKKPGLHCQANKVGYRYHLKTIYQQHGIPDWLRPYIPLVYLNNKLVAIAGICLCQHNADVIVSQQGIQIIWHGATYPFDMVR